ncbi:YihY/virulence factor BrkB family protein [Rhodohalobacter sp. 8-1]|uniref:YihY/virulence factor BrkB family protein n=1 Tax=Rhodohalobacter sp. 8-1 TaxID=3131972 RepID=UPI0030EC5BB1
MKSTRWQKFKNYWKLVGRLAMKKNVFFNASAITFNLFLCAIPFTLILISLLGYILSIEAAFDEVIRYARELFPSFTFETRGEDVFEGVVTIEELIMPLVEARRIFGIVGIIILTFFSQGLLHSLKHVLFEVFDIEERQHPVMELVYNFFTFGVVGGVFLFFTIAISLISLYPVDSISIPFTETVIQLGWITEFLARLVPAIFTPLLFYVIFRYISEKRISRKVSFLAAIIYTVLFETAKYGVGLYLGYALTAYRYYYQGYTIPVIIGVWVFYSAVLFVLTAVMARAYQDVYEKERPSIEKNPYTAIS